VAGSAGEWQDENYDLKCVHFETKKVRLTSCLGHTNGNWTLANLLTEGNHLGRATLS
jgi:hypothetical protein